MKDGRVHKKREIFFELERKELERWLSGEDQWLLFQNNQGEIPAPIWKLLPACNSSSRRFKTLTQAYVLGKHQ